MTRHFWQWTCAALLSLGCALGANAWAADDKPAAEKKDTDKKAAADKDGEEAKEDRYKVPDGDADALLKFIEKVSSFRPRSRAELEEHMTKYPAAVKSAADKIVELEKDPKSTKSLRAKTFILQQDARKAFAGGAEAQTAYYKSAKEHFAALGDKIGRPEVSLAMTVGQILEFTKNENAAEAFETFSEQFAKSSDKDVKELAGMFAGTARRMKLVGNTIQVTGKTMDGKDFDWAKYRGKVVLIDFWATWCGPCRAELPNVKKNYDLYHSKGFDVVGISLDRDRSALEDYVKKEELPWTQLFEEGVEWKHPTAVYYGVSAIPTVILVDKDGKVVSLSARGPELGKQLEKLLGPAEEKDEKKEDKKSDK